MPSEDGLTAGTALAGVGDPDGVHPTLAQSQRPTPRRRWSRRVQVAVLIVGFAGVIVTARNIDFAPWLYPYALMGHLVFLAVSFGAVLAIEVHGVGFLLRLVSTGRMATVALSLDPLIWAGLIGMCATGVVLGPQLDQPLTMVKLAAVFVAGLNGLSARGLAQELRRLPSRAHWSALPPGILGRAARASAISQLSWWTAFIIGFLTTNG